MSRPRFVVVVLILNGFFILSCSSTQQSIPQKQTITGKIRVIGNAPFAKLAIENEEGQIFVLDCTKEMETTLLQHQGQFVKIQADSAKKTLEGTIVKVVHAEALTNK